MSHADESMATWRLLKARVDQPRESAQRNAEIWNAAAREILRVSRHRDRELGVVAHELRQPLAAAINASRLLDVTTDPDALGRARNVLRRQLTHLATLVEDLLQYSRFSVRPQSSAYATHDVRQIVAAAVETIEPAVDERRQVLRVRAPDECCSINGDASRLERAIVNLLQNAVRYTPEGGEIAVGVRVDADQVTVDVIDRRRHRRASSRIDFRSVLPRVR